METTNKNDFINIYVLKTLNEIKNTIKRNIKLDKEKETEIDSKMSIVLKDLINANSKNFQKDPNGNLIYTLLPIVDEKENKKIRLSLVLYYTALYYDNVDLLHDLLKEDIGFDKQFYINLQYLDKSISSKFERERYIEMIKTCGYIFRNFAKSIESLTEEEREKYIQRFVKLINLKYDLVKNILNKKTWYYELEDLFNKQNLDTFTDKTYEQATEKQLRLIDSSYRNNYSKETCDRLNNLMQTKGFSNHLSDLDLMMTLYTDEKLCTLDYFISRAISNFSQTEKSLNKVIDFIQRRPDLATSIINISPETFVKFDNFTLIELCDKIDHLHNKEEDLSMIAKFLKLKIALKKALGSYEPKDVQRQNGRMKKLTPPKQ